MASQAFFGPDGIGSRIMEDFEPYTKDKKLPGSTSLTAILSTLVPTVATAVLFLAIFVLIRDRYRRIYMPRTYIGVVPEKDRTPSASRSRFDWMHTFRVVDDKFLLQHQSIDAYLYLRFLRTIIFICFVGACLTWPILMPVNYTGDGKAKQLDRIAIGNIAKAKNGHLYAHAVIAWVFFGFIMFLVARERIWLVGLRQAWHLAKPNATRLSSRTVLFLSAPKSALDENNLHKNFSNNATRLWPVSKAEALEALVSSRNSKVEELESAELELSKNANKKRLRANRSQGNGEAPDYAGLPDVVKTSLRPTKYLTKPAGKKVDKIEWLRKQVKEKASEVEEARKSHTAPDSHINSAVFVEFTTQSAAQKAYQQLPSSKILAMNPRYIGVLPKEVIWDNLTIHPASRISQGYIANALVAATIIFWTIPITVIGAISNIEYLTDKVKFLGFINNLPAPILGLLTGLLPPFLTSLFVSYVPNIFRWIAKSSGQPTNTQAELKVQNWYYAFQFIQVFLVTSLSSAAAAVATQIAQNPAGVPEMLARQIPKASNFYLTYIILQGTASAAKNVLNYSDLFSYLFFDYFMDKTPRQKYSRYTSLKGIGWGNVYPKFTNIAIIAIAYACIAPLVLGFAAIGVFFYYLSYRHNLLFVIQTKIDTRGECYTRALQQLLTGVYVAELCLIGLFGIHKATGPLVMTAILLGVTIIYNITMNYQLSPLEKYLPADLEAADEDAEETPLLSAAEEGNVPSRVQRVGQEMRVPKQVVDPIARFFEPHIFASHKAMKTWLLDDGGTGDEVQEYSEDDVKNAYTNPAFTSKTPKVWLAKDEMGVSKIEVEENEAAGISATDQGAWLEGKKVRWDEDDFPNVPLYKVPVKY
ncbi:DUF221-domain-containing protein [Mytilinidion resinicola]|uniref:DUF221-domain-containing protein n=1 Tax=Mytilinidion resinicola TaxID=574789 RepID=A0A6A6Z103_9PEZI|nr:DUF221-domain-containing protein [Mytilinidion resinicola]KAF2814842.1 DUF221-domain-containing protein [Mytilinidion resinicola]